MNVSCVKHSYGIQLSPELAWSERSVLATASFLGQIYNMDPSKGHILVSERGLGFAPAQVFVAKWDLGDMKVLYFKHAQVITTLVPWFQGLCFDPQIFIYNQYLTRSSTRMDKAKRSILISGLWVPPVSVSVIQVFVTTVIMQMFMLITLIITHNYDCSVQILHSHCHISDNTSYKQGHFLTTVWPFPNSPFQISLLLTHFYHLSHFNL